MRGFLFGLAAAVAACVLVSYAELWVKTVQISVLQLPPVAVALLLVMVVISAALKRVRAKWGLTPQELLIIYSMSALSAMVSSRGLLEKIIPVLVSPSYFANQSNRWADLYFPHIKRWMVPFDLGASQPDHLTKRFYEGLRVGETLPWHQWIGPLAMWGILAMCIFGTFLCLAAILRKHWAENEKLSFPLVQLPMEIASSGQRGVLSNPLTWAGFGVAALIYSLNGLHLAFPNIPELPLTYVLGFANPPFDAWNGIRVVVCFAAIGLFFLLPVDLLCSIWFFYLFMNFQKLLAVSYNMDMPTLPLYYVPVFIGYQAIGAYIVLAGFLAYTARRHLASVLKSAFRIEKVDDSNELMPYRTAVFGLVLCFLGSVVWLRMAGMSAWLAFFELGAYIFLIALVMARSTVESGLMMTETSFRAVDIYRLFGPTNALGTANMTVLAFMDAAFFRDLRGLVLTAFLDGTVIADNTKMRRRKFLPIYAVAIVAAVVIGCAFQLWLSYDRGGVNLYGYTYLDNNIRGFKDYEPAMLGPVSALSWQGPFFLGVGIVLTALLCWARYLFFWWPLNPLGYAISASWTVTVLWFSSFIAWLAKSQILRYGGMRVYVAARPFFIGLVIGEFSISVVWALAAWAFGCQGPQFVW